MTNSAEEGHPALKKLACLSAASTGTCREFTGFDIFIEVSGRLVINVGRFPEAGSPQGCFNKSGVVPSRALTRNREAKPEPLRLDVWFTSEWPR